MDVTQTAPDQATDRRVRRSRAALMSAALALVAEHGTTNVAVSEIAEAADVSRQLIYQQFGDRDTLLLETAVDLVRSDLLPRVAQTTHPPGGTSRVLAAVRHFAEHRSFYRAMITGPCAYPLARALDGLLSHMNEQGIVPRMSQVPLDRSLAADLTIFVTGGWWAVISAWVVEAPDPLDPEAFAQRLLRMVPALLDPGGETSVTPTPEI